MKLYIDSSIEWYTTFKLLKNASRLRYLITYNVNMWFPRQVFIDVVPTEFKTRKECNDYFADLHCLV